MCEESVCDESSAMWSPLEVKWPAVRGGLGGPRPLSAGRVTGDVPTTTANLYLHKSIHDLPAISGWEGEIKFNIA